MAEVLCSEDFFQKPLPFEQADAARRGLFSGLNFVTVIHTLTMMLALYALTVMFATAGPVMFKIGVTVRYLLWIMILISITIEVFQRGVLDILEPLNIFIPFFLIGVISALVSQQPFDGARELIFWLVSSLAASANGRRLGERLCLQLLCWMFFAMMVASIAVATLFPMYGVTSDLRASGNVWNGAFLGKNWLGYYSDIAIVVTLLTPGLRLWLRVVMVATAVVCLYFSHSSGALANLAITLTFAGLLSFMRRSRLSNSMQAFLLMVSLLGIAAICTMFTSELLGLLNRDTHFSGRNVIWSMYGERALQHWPLGAGPGSFTYLSNTTVDIGLSLQGLGEIQTPHNIYIAVFGEVGLFGFTAFICALGYLIFVLPFRELGRTSQMLASYCVLIAVSGFTETHQVFGIGIGIYLIILLKASLGIGRASTSRQANTEHPAAPRIDDTIYGGELHPTRDRPRLLG